VHVAPAFFAAVGLTLTVGLTSSVPVVAATSQSDEELPQSTSNSILLSGDADHPGAGVQSVERVEVVRPGSSGGSSSGGGSAPRGRPAAPARARTCSTSDAPWPLQWAMDGLARRAGKPGAYHRPTTTMIPGDSYYRECRYHDDGSLERDAFRYWPPTAARPAAAAPVAAPQIDVMTIVRQVYAEVPLALPVPHTSPPVDADQLVGFPVWMWVDDTVWRSFDAHASVAGITVTVVAQPKSLRWNMGDGTVISCAGPGTAWVEGSDGDQRSDCSHIYQYVSAHEPDGRYHASVTVSWSVAWSASTGEGGALPDASRSASFDLNVVERQAVITYGR
jgi:hypothetical protein